MVGVKIYNCFFSSSPDSSNKMCLHFCLGFCWCLFRLLDWHKIFKKNHQLKTCTQKWKDLIGEDHRTSMCWQFCFVDRSYLLLSDHPLSFWETKGSTVNCFFDLHFTAVCELWAKKTKTLFFVLYNNAIPTSAYWHGKLTTDNMETISFKPRASLSKGIRFLRSNSLL